MEKLGWWGEKRVWWEGVGGGVMDQIEPVVDRVGEQGRGLEASRAGGAAEGLDVDVHAPAKRAQTEPLRQDVDGGEGSQLREEGFLEVGDEGGEGGEGVRAGLGENGLDVSLEREGERRAVIELVEVGGEGGESPWVNTQGPGWWR